MTVRSFAAALSLLPLVAQGALQVEVACPGSVVAGQKLSATVVLSNDDPYETTFVHRLFVTVVGTSGAAATDVAVYGPFQRHSGAAASGIAPGSSVTVTTVVLPAAPAELKGKVAGVAVAARPQGKKKYKAAECPVRID